MIILSGNNRCYFSDENLYIVKPGTNSSKILVRPPAVNPAFASPNEKHGTHRTPMDQYGWDEYMKKLNGDKFDAAVHWGLAMFNNRTRPDFYEGGAQMESLFFSGNLLRAVPHSYGWMRVITLDYYAGPPDGMPTFEQNPIFVQQFTTINRINRVVKIRIPELYYPVVSKYTVYMPERCLMPFHG